MKIRAHLRRRCKYIRRIRRLARQAGCDVVESDSRVVDLGGYTTKKPLVVIVPPGAVVNLQGSKTDGILVVAYRGLLYKPAFVAAYLDKALQDAALARTGKLNAGWGGVTLDCRYAHIGKWWTWPENKRED